MRCTFCSELAKARRLCQRHYDRARRTGSPLSPDQREVWNLDPTRKSPSLDRIRPELGYIPGNVRVISWRANRIKNDATAEELEKILEYVRS